MTKISQLIALVRQLDREPSESLNGSEVVSLVEVEALLREYDGHVLLTQEEQEHVLASAQLSAHNLADDEFDSLVGKIDRNLYLRKKIEEHNRC